MGSAVPRSGIPLAIHASHHRHTVAGGEPRRVRLGALLITVRIAGTRSPPSLRLDDQGDATDAEVLVIADAPVAGERQVEARSLSAFNNSPLLNLSQPWTAVCTV